MVCCWYNQNPMTDEWEEGWRGEYQEENEYLSLFIFGILGIFRPSSSCHPAMSSRAVLHGHGATIINLANLKSN